MTIAATGPLPTLSVVPAPRDPLPVDHVAAQTRRLRTMLATSRPSGDWWWQLSRVLVALEDAVYPLGRAPGGEDPQVRDLIGRIKALHARASAYPRVATDVITSAAQIAADVERLTSGLAAEGRSAVA